jgi:hypothetical protein
MTDKIPKMSQLYFFLMPAETYSLFEFMIAQKYALYNPRSTGTKPCRCVSPVGISQIFYSPFELTSEIVMNKINDEIYTLDSTTSPVIEINLPLLYEDGLTRGRIYFRGGYIGRDKWISFESKLYTAYKDVVSFLKKHFLTKKRIHGAYLSKDSQSYVSQGGVLLQF